MDFKQLIRTSKDFRSLINPNSRANSEITIETVRMINNEITAQATRKLAEIREDRNSQILEVINSAIAEEVLPSIQNVLGGKESGLNSARDHLSGRIDCSPEDHFGILDPRSGRLDCNPSGHSGRAVHRTKRPDSGPVGSFGQKDHLSRGLDRNHEDRSSPMDHQSRGLDHGLRDHFGQTDHWSDRQDGSLVGQFSQVDHRSRRPDKSP